MYLPKIYENFSGKFPEVFNDFKQLGQTCREAGPLDPKCQDLIKLGIAIGANSKGAVMSSTRKALESGSTRRRDWPCRLAVIDDHRFSQYDCRPAVG